MIKFSERALFTLALTAFAGVLLYLTLDMGRLARMVPLRVVIPTLVLLIFQLVVDLVPPLAQKYKKLEKMDLFGVEPLQDKALAQANPGKASGKAPLGQRELSMFLWVIMMLAFIYLLGFLIAVPLYTFLYLKARSREGWLLSITITAGMWGLLYGVFILILGVSLYEGQLWHWMGI